MAPGAGPAAGGSIHDGLSNTPSRHRSRNPRTTEQVAPPEGNAVDGVASPELPDIPSHGCEYAYHADDLHQAILSLTGV